MFCNNFVVLGIIPYEATLFPIFVHQLLNMTKYYFSLLSFVFLIQSAQSQQSMDSDLKAFMFHVVVKSPILNENIGKFFEYSGPVIKLPNGDINYDSIDVIISNKPDFLFIRSSEIAKCSPGIVAELANKTAIWELNRTMMAYMQGDEAELLRYQAHFDKFEALLVENLPASMVKSTSKGKTFEPRLKEVLNPSVSFNLKRDVLLGMRTMNLTLAQEVLEAINFAVQQWVEDRTFQLFSMLGGKTSRFENVLIAAGDGSLTSGLLDERERDSRGRFYRGLPRAIGFFPYQMHIIANKEGQDELRPLSFPAIDLYTAGAGRITNIHPDIWGYNGSKQTTMVIDKGGRQYLLFGSGETRFLSPDSSYNSGGTFMSVINELEFIHIAQLREKIYGKQGFDYWIAYNEAEIEKTRQEILSIELDLKKYKSSSTRRNSKSGKKKIRDLQARFIAKQNYYDKCELNIKKLTKEKEDASNLLDQYEARLSQLKRMIGNAWMSWTMKDGFFVFEDGATFDIRTQDFRFPPTIEPEYFEVRLLAVPFSALKRDVDEVMLHLSMSDMLPDFDKAFNIGRVDWFASNSYELNSPIFSAEDSVVIKDILDAVTRKMKIEVNALGLGIGKMDHEKLVRDLAAVEEMAYPGETVELRAEAAEGERFKSLRRTELAIDLKNGILIDVKSSTDPVRTNFAPESLFLAKLLSQGKITPNEALSVYRTAAVLHALKKELINYAGEFLEREKATAVIDYLDNEFKKIKINVGAYSVKLSDL